MYAWKARVRATVSRPGSFRPAVEALENRWQPGSLLGAGEFAVIGADLFDQDPVTHRLESQPAIQRLLSGAETSSSALSGGIVLLAQDPQQESHAVQTASQPVQAAPPLRDGNLLEQARVLPSLVNAGAVSDGQPGVGRANVRSLSAQPMELTRLRTNVFQATPVHASDPLASLAYTQAFNTTVASLPGITVAVNATAEIGGYTFVAGWVEVSPDLHGSFAALYDPAGTMLSVSVFHPTDPAATYDRSEATGIAIDLSSLSVLIVGTARDANNQDTDQYVLKTDFALTTVAWSYGLGGARNDIGNGVAVNQTNGNVYIVGDYSAPPPPQGPGGIRPSVFALDTAGTIPPIFALYYDPFMGSTGGTANGVALDANGNVHIAGSETNPTDGTTAMAFRVRGTDGGGGTGITFDNPPGTGTAGFRGVALAADGLPVFVGNVPGTGGTNGFAAKVNAAYDDAVWLAAFTDTLEFSSIAADPFFGTGLHIAGTVVGAASGHDALVLNLSEAGMVIQSLIISGASADTARGISFSASDQLIRVVGTTSSADWPTTNGTQVLGPSDGFLAHVSLT